MMKLLLISALMSVSAAQAGMQTTTEQKVFAPKPDTCAQNTYFDATFIRFDVSCKDTFNTAIVYDQKKDSTYNIDYKRKTYTVMTIHEAKELGRAMGPQMEKMKQVQEQMMANMKSLPPEQRKMMAKMMGAPGRLLGEPTHKKVGAVKTVNGYKCQPYETWASNQKIGESCIADWKDAGVDFSKYLKISESWKKHLDEVYKSGPQSMIPKQAGDWTKGFAVQYKVFIDGALQNESTVKEVKEAALPSSLASPPADFKKEPNPIEMMKAQAKKKK